MADIYGIIYIYLNDNLKLMNMETSQIYKIMLLKASWRQSFIIYFLYD